MSIPPEITALIQRLNSELDEVEQETVEGLELIRAILILLPNNALLTQIFATLTNYTLFVEISRRRIDRMRMTLTSDIVTNEQVQNAGEDLAELLGQALEAKVVVNSVKTRLEN